MDFWSFRFAFDQDTQDTEDGVVAYIEIVVSDRLTISDVPILVWNTSQETGARSLPKVWPICAGFK